MCGTCRSNEGLRRVHRIPPSFLSQRNRAVPACLRMHWVVSGDPKAITRDVTRYLLAHSVSYVGHHGRARIVSEDRGGAGEGRDAPPFVEGLRRAYRGPGGVGCSAAELLRTGLPRTSRCGVLRTSAKSHPRKLARPRSNAYGRSGPFTPAVSRPVEQGLWNFSSISHPIGTICA
jgi:hypothetical protein